MALLIGIVCMVGIMFLSLSKSLSFRQQSHATNERIHPRYFHYVLPNVPSRATRNDQGMSRIDNHNSDKHDNSQSESSSEQMYTFRAKRLDPDMDLYPSKRRIYVSKTTLRRRDNILDSREYKYGMADEFENKDCKAQYSWQLTSFPTCNNLHEADLGDLQAVSKQDMRVSLLAHGYWRDVWMVRESLNGTKRVLKTLRYEHGYEARNYDRHRRDAVAMERLTRSPLVVDIYGFCGNSGIFQYANGGDISDAIWPRKKDRKALTALRRLEIGE